MLVVCCIYPGVFVFVVVVVIVLLLIVVYVIIDTRAIEQISVVNLVAMSIFITIFVVSIMMLIFVFMS